MKKNRESGTIIEKQRIGCDFLSQRVENSRKIKKMTYLAILTAMVFILQWLGLFMRFTTFSLTFVLVPIVIGTAICGVYAGAWLGFVFAIAVFATGDAALFLQFSIFGTIVTVVLKGILSGLCAGLVYKLFEKKNKYLAIVSSAVTAPIVNSGIFFLGCLVFFYDSIADYFKTDSVVWFIITGLIGINFIIEFVLNLILSPAIYRILEIAKPSFKK